MARRLCQNEFSPITRWVGRRIVFEATNRFRGDEYRGDELFLKRRIVFWGDKSFRGDESFSTRRIVFVATNIGATNGFCDGKIRPIQGDKINNSHGDDKYFGNASSTSGNETSDVGLVPRPHYWPGAGNGTKLRGLIIVCRPVENNHVILTACTQCAICYKQCLK